MSGWAYPMPPTNEREQERYDAEHARRIALQQDISTVDMPGPLLIGACCAGGMLLGLFGG